jgi:DNA processing protein
LIRDGATLLTGVDDILSELNYLDGLRPAAIPEKTTGGTALAASNLTAEEAQVYACFAGGAMVSIDAVSGQTGLPTAQLSATLMMLELKRLIAKRADGTFEAR